MMSSEGESEGELAHPQRATAADAAIHRPPRSWTAIAASAPAGWREMHYRRAMRTDAWRVTVPQCGRPYAEAMAPVYGVELLVRDVVGHVVAVSYTHLRAHETRHDLV